MSAAPVRGTERAGRGASYHMIMVEWRLDECCGIVTHGHLLCFRRCEG